MLVLNAFEREPLDLLFFGSILCSVFVGSPSGAGADIAPLLVGENGRFCLSISSVVSFFLGS